MRIIGPEIRSLKQKDATKRKKKTMEVPNHQASSRDVGSRSGLKRWGPRTIITRTCQEPVSTRLGRAV